MFVLCWALLVVVQACQAIPLHLEINHRNPETGEIESTSRFEIDDDLISEGNLEPQIPPLSEREIDPSVMEYYFDCSMPIPPIIENSDYEIAVRQTEPSTEAAVFDTALAGINGIALNVFNVGFSLYNIIRS